MKKLLFLICLLSLTQYIQSQTAIPNGGFETWNSSNYEYPTNYPFNSNVDMFTRHDLGPNLVKTSSAYHGNSAIKLTTMSKGQDVIEGFFININPDKEDPNQWTGGMPYNEKPKGVRGYYKYNPVSTDSAMVIISFSKLGTNIGTYFYKIGGVHSNYTLFNFDLVPALSVVPDSMSFGVTSSDVMSDTNRFAGSELIIDSVSLTGVINQPTQMGGDFETWAPGTSYNVANWYIQRRDDLNGMTTDAYSGAYAIELVTMVDYKNNPPSAQPAQLSTGYWDNSCNCMRGGYPFNRLTDTIGFWYKYSPSGGDTASMQISFKKNGIQIGGMNYNITASTNYRYIEFPINYGMLPDTLIVLFQSSLYQHDATSYAGSLLKIDQVRLKSEIIQLPAPSVGTITQPTCTVATGSVVINSLPAGSWKLLKYPGGSVQTGTGTSYTYTALSSGTYYFKLVVGTDTSAATSNVVINTQPATPLAPVITRSGMVLHSDAASGNQWYKDSILISGAILQDYTATGIGNYFCIVTLNSCSSPKSNTINISSVGMQENKKSKTFQVFPNPFINQIVLGYVGENQTCSYYLMNAIGQIVKQGSARKGDTIQTADLSAGLYYLFIQTEEEVNTFNLIKW